MGASREGGTAMRPAWVTRQIKDFVDQFVADATLIGVANTDMLLRRYGTGPGAPAVRIELLGYLPKSDGFVWHPPAGRGLPQLWLSPTKTGYRDIFERFARRYLGAQGLAAADVQIDHVFPKKAGSMGGMAYVRMLAVPPASNMAAGRTLEKEMVARNGELGGRRKLTRTANYFSVGKATGFIGYTALPDDDEASGANAAQAAALMAHLRAWGLPSSVLTALDLQLTQRSLAWQR
jgi:hypothetical protein